MSAIRLVAVCGPRGAGKETILTALRNELGLHRIVPHTTRAPRQTEQNGREYHFVPDAVFDELIAKERFVWFGSIGPTQRSGTVIEEFTRARSGCVIDVKPDGARVMRDRLKLIGGAVILLCIMAELFERRERIRLREPGISYTEVERLIAEDPVSQDVSDYHDFHEVIWNSGNDPVRACRRAVELTSRFILQEA
jgi:guanylate kinase